MTPNLIKKREEILHVENKNNPPTKKIIGTGPSSRFEDRRTRTEAVLALSED
jgi:hypothetical protein